MLRKPSRASGFCEACTVRATHACSFLTLGCPLHRSYGSVSGTEHCAHACALLSFVIFVGASLTDFLLAKKNSEAASPVAVPATIAALSFLRAFVFAPSGGKKKKE